MRHLGDSGEAYRLRVDNGYRVSYVGPYATAAVARAQRTRLLRQHGRWQRPGSTQSPPPTIAVERAATAWTEVPE